MSTKDPKSAVRIRNQAKRSFVLHTLWRRAIIGVAGLFTGANIAILSGCAAQPYDEVGCPECFLELDLVTTLQFGGDSILLDERFSLATDGSGRYFHIEHGRHRFYVFDSEGGLIKAVGQQGDGPGEFRRLSNVMVCPVFDTVYVLESTGRLSVFTPDLAFMRVAFVPIFNYRSSTILPARGESRLLFDGVVRGAVAEGEPLHFMDFRGSLLGSFGSGSGERTGGPSIASGEQNLWLSRPASERYVIEKWSIDGEHLKNYAIDGSPWLSSAPPKPAKHQDILDYFGQPPTILQLWREDRHHTARVWTIILTPKEPRHVPPPEAIERIEPHIMRDRSGGINLMGLTVDDLREIGLLPSLQDRLFDTVIELVDLETSRVLVSTQFKADLQQIKGSDYLFSRNRDTYGVTRSIDIWRIRIVGGVN